MRIIYTALFSRYEELKEPTVITPGWRYICLTDQPLQSDVWEIHHFANVDNPVKLAREKKILGGFGSHIWIDASFKINCDLNEFWDKHFISPFTVVQHPLRNCVYSEFTACIDNKRADYRSLVEQRELFLKNKVPVNNGLIQSGILLRENTPAVKEFCNLWWDQIKLSTRDQIGFAYAEWKLGIKWPRIVMDYRNNENFIFKTHFKRRQNAIRTSQPGN